MLLASLLGYGKYVKHKRKNPMVASKLPTKAISGGLPEGPSNRFSKKFVNFNDALNLHSTYYNFCRMHRSLRMTPAMKAGIIDDI